MMGKGKKIQIPKPVDGDLELYRRLIEIQKEVAKMAKQHERSRRECDALRERVAREAIASLRGRGGMRYRLRLSTFKLFRRLPRLAATEFFRVLNYKQSSSC
jgi:hypothetical protein